MYSRVVAFYAGPISAKMEQKREKERAFCTHLLERERLSQKKRGFRSNPWFVPFTKECSAHAPWGEKLSLTRKGRFVLIIEKVGASDRYAGAINHEKYSQQAKFVDGMLIAIQQVNCFDAMRNFLSIESRNA